MTVKTRYLIAILVAIAAAFMGTISIVRVDLGGKLVEAVKTAIPKLRVVRAGGCDYIYDRDDGKLVATKCASDPSAYQETIDKLRGQLEAANSQIQKFKQEVESARARVAELERESIARADVTSKALSESEAANAELRREVERLKSINEQQSRTGNQDVPAPTTKGLPSGCFWLVPGKQFACPRK